MDNVVNTNDLDIDYVLIYKDKENILNDVDFNETDRFICEAIIDNLEKEISKQIKVGKTVSIPFIGTIESNWYRNSITSKYDELREFKENHTKEEYKEYFKSVAENIRKEHTEKEEKSKRFNRFKSKVLGKYVNHCKRKGVVWANAWLKSISLLEVVKFDPDIEEVYERFRTGLDADD